MFLRFIKENFRIVRVFLCISLLVFSSCNFLLRSQEVISKEEYDKMVKGKFEKLSDVINLFPKSVDDVNRRVDLALQEAKKELDKIIKLDDKSRSFNNTARALDRVENQFSVVSSGISVCEQVNPNKAIRDSCYQAAIKMSEFAVDAFLNVDLYKAFKSYIQGNAKKELLNDEEKYFLKEVMQEFIRSGLNLPEDELAQVKKLQKELSELSLSFNRNVALDNSFIEVGEDALKGVDPHFIKQLETTKVGKKVRCDYPTRSEVLKHCFIENTRQQLSLAFSNRAYPVNKKVLLQIISKRDELAKRLGFKSYTDFDLDNQMVKSTKIATNFIIDLAKKVEKKEQEEFERFCSDLPADVKLTNGKLDPWNVAYVKEYYKKKHFDLDDRQIAEYFTMEDTVDGIFEIYQEFLGLEFKLLKPKGLWHKDVTLIQILKKDSNIIQGYIFLDLYPRDNKYSHACMASVFPALKTEDEVAVPSVSVVIANFPKSTKERPSLLKHNDVITFFHEFGHAMHHLLGRTELVHFSGTETKSDFVEVPSQMFEEWMWDKKMLAKISKHYKTGDSLPENLIDKMIELKRFDSGGFVQIQCNYSLLSLAYFLPGAEKDVDKIMQDLHAQYIKNVRFEPKGHFYASFGHLVSGLYGAKYYSYMWAKVFALDLFDAIRKYGLLDHKIGQKLINKVLGKGGSVDPNVLLRDFLGREPNQDAFLKDIGIEK